MNGPSGAGMNRGAAQALRLAAGVRVVEAAIGVAGFFTTRWLSSAVQRPGAPIEAILHRFEIIGAVERWAAVGCLAAVLIALALLCAALERGARRLAVGALVGTTVYVALMLFNQLVPPVASSTTPYRYSLLREAIWFVQLVAGCGSMLLTLLAATPPTGATRRARRATIAFAALAMALLAFKIVTLIAPRSGNGAEPFQMAWYAIDTAGYVVFSLGAFWLARAHEQAGPAPAAIADAALGNLDPRPLRLLGRTIILRVAVGAPLAIVAALATAQGAAEIGLLALIAATIMGVVVTAMLVTSLAGQRRLPAALCDREALTIAIVTAAPAPVFDAWSAVATGQILSLLGATSFFGMPSSSRIEELRTAATWTGRVSLCLGLAASFAIVRSLTATARGLADEALAVRAGRVRALLIYGTGGAVTAWMFVSNVELRGDGALMTLALIGVGLLAIGVVLVVELLRLAFGLANAIERPSPAAEISLPSPT